MLSSGSTLKLTTGFQPAVNAWLLQHNPAILLQAWEHCKEKPRLVLLVMNALSGIHPIEQAIQWLYRGLSLSTLEPFRGSNCVQTSTING
jgi:hypothetical protein